MDGALRGLFGGLVCSVHTGQPHGARSQSAYCVRTTPVHASPYCAQARRSLILRTPVVHTHTQSSLRPVPLRENGVAACGVVPGRSMTPGSLTPGPLVRSLTNPY